MTLDLLEGKYFSPLGSLKFCSPEDSPYAYFLGPMKVFLRFNIKVQVIQYPLFIQ